ncbi:MAG TPA: serine/threonine-protein kinase, partial [Planctomycetia bacterium]|nr:serine/threonine-protein kinase [Planctomycetia bacterium]
MDAERNLWQGLVLRDLDLVGVDRLQEALSLLAGGHGGDLLDLLAARGWITAADRIRVAAIATERRNATLASAPQPTQAFGLGIAFAGAPPAPAVDSTQPGEPTLADDETPRIRLGAGLESTAIDLGGETPRSFAGGEFNSATTQPFVSLGDFEPSDRHVEQRYIRVSLHAEGGLGKVWLARDQALQREVALKELHAARACSVEARQRFLREARITGRLEHPHIVPVYQVHVPADDEAPYYTMRLVRGDTLSKRIAAYHATTHKDPLALQRLLSAFIAVCQATAFAHSRGVIHRDLKPDNVLVGEYGEVVLLDWGLAKLVGGAENEAHPGTFGAATGDPNDSADALLTLDGRVLGTPGYMAPEQASGFVHLTDSSTDVYGLGAVLFAILTGGPPHHGGQSAASTVESILIDPTPSPRNRNPQTPPALDAICRKAMAREQSD